MSDFPVLTSIIFFPFLACICLFFIKKENTSRIFTLIVSILEIVIALPLLNFQSGTTEYQFVERIAWMPVWGLEYYLGVDGISILMVWLTVCILPLCVLCSWTYIGTRVKEFHFCLLFMTAACLGVFCSLDFVLFYIFWEAMLVPMYLLIAVWGGPERRYASIKFFLYTLAGSTLLLVALVAFRIAGGTFSIPELMKQSFGYNFQIWAFLGMAIAFAIKVPMFPFHTWLPAAHVEAPTAGSVLLASILLKMGTYGFLRFCLPLTPLACDYFAPLMIGVSIASILYGGAVALGQEDMKKIIAYSSVGHMGFVTLGIFIFNQRGVEGAIFQMLNHGITTGALFMMVGTVYERSHSRLVMKNLGIAKYMPAYIGFFGLFTFSSFGFPGTNSFVGELLVLIGSFQANPWIGAAIIPGVLLAAAYMIRLAQKLSWGMPTSFQKGWKDLSGREWSYLLPCAFFVLYIGLAPGIFFKTIESSVNGLITDFKQKNEAYNQTVVAEYKKPILAIVHDSLNVDDKKK